MKLAWNAIVKNEAAIIERCVRSLLPHIDCAIVVDTGSTDGTPQKIQALFDAAGKPVEIRSAMFENFEQARNEALRCARLSKLEWDYLLLADADMEFRVKKAGWLNGEKGLSYDLRQVAGPLGYHNRRLVSRLATGWYVGVTHEYLDVASSGPLDGAEFVDHADGANRPDKIGRDIALLEEALKIETREGLIQRYHFYLAGSYYDKGNIEEAIKHYRIRVTLGGFDEEVWYAQMRYAQCLRKIGSDAMFVTELLRAYQLRPQRAEPLHELAKFYREKGDNAASLLFSAPGMQALLPDDQLFVNDWVYKTGLKEEFAICAWYDKSKRRQGAKVCDELALRGSGQARNNLFWYLKPLVEHVPSFRPTRIELPLPDGYSATNPSATIHDGQLVAVVRSVNYTITQEGMYAVLGADGSVDRFNPIVTRNHLVHFSSALTVESLREIALPADWPAPPKFDLVIGFEDSRLFSWGGDLWTLSCVRELTPEGWCEQVFARVLPAGYANWSVIRPEKRRHEKNWMPWVKDGELRFVYRLGTLVGIDGKVVENHKCRFDVNQISGSSQVIEAGGFNLALVHEARTIPAMPQLRYYQHRFVTLGNDGELIRVSPAFCFHDKQIEFAAGLAYVPDTGKLVVSYGVRDCEAWLAEMDFVDVIAFIIEGSDHVR